MHIRFVTITITNMLHKIAHILLIIGGLNWLLIGLFNWGVGNILGSTITTIVYVLVGLAAVYDLFTLGNCNRCKGEKKAAPAMNAN